MGFPVVQLGVTDNWDILWSGTLNPVQVSGGGYTPIPKTVVPVQCSSPIIAVYVASATHDVQRPYAGYICQTFITGITGSNIPTTQASDSKKVYQNRLQLITFNPLASSFGLLLCPPYYFKDISYTIYEYLGSYTDSTENLINNSVIPPLNTLLSR